MDKSKTEGAKKAETATEFAGKASAVSEHEANSTSSNVVNWNTDTGTTSHMTPHRSWKGIIPLIEYLLNWQTIGLFNQKVLALLFLDLLSMDILVEMFNFLESYMYQLYIIIF